MEAGRSVRPLSTFVDTNVLVYAVDGDEPVKRARAEDVLRELGDSAVISPQVMGEFYVTARRRFADRHPSGKGSEWVDEFSLLRVVPLDRKIVSAAVRLAETLPISYWDALIVSTAAAAGCDRILTEDLADGTTVAGIVIENPFR